MFIHKSSGILKVVFIRCLSYYFLLFYLGLTTTSTAGAFATDSSFSNVFGNQSSTLDPTGKGPYLMTSAALIYDVANTIL